MGSLPDTGSFLRVEPENVVVTALKKAEDSGDLIVRFYEWAGKSGTVRLQFRPGAESARETDLMETPSASLVIDAGSVLVPTKPYEITTVQVHLSKPAN